MATQLCSTQVHAEITIAPGRAPMIRVTTTKRTASGPKSLICKCLFPIFNLRIMHVAQLILKLNFSAWTKLFFQKRQSLTPLSMPLLFTELFHSAKYLAFLTVKNPHLILTHQCWQCSAGSPFCGTGTWASLSRRR